MVRLQTRLGRKRYLNSKRAYEYERFLLPIPKNLRGTIKSFLNEDLDLRGKVEDGSLALTLTPAETLRHAANTSLKHR